MKKYILEILCSIIIFLLVFNLTVGESNILFVILILSFVSALFLILHGFRNIFKEINYNRIKNFIHKHITHIIISLIIVLVVLLPIINYVLNKPLEMYCKTDNYGNYYVSSSNDDKFFYTLNFTSDYEIESWRASLVSFLASNDNIKQELAPKLLINNKEMRLKASGASDEKMIMTLKVRYTYGFNPFEYHKLNTTYKNGLENGSMILQFNKIFERPNSEKQADIIDQECAVPSRIFNKKLNKRSKTIQRYLKDYDINAKTLYEDLEKFYKNHNGFKSEEELQTALWNDNDINIRHLISKIHYVDKYNYIFIINGHKLSKEDLKNVADGKLLYFQDNIDSKFIDRIKELFPKKEIMRYDL